jgi:hypothetical protein
LLAGPVAGDRRVWAGAQGPGPNGHLPKGHKQNWGKVRAEGTLASFGRLACNQLIRVRIETPWRATCGATEPATTRARTLIKERQRPSYLDTSDLLIENAAVVI